MKADPHVLGLLAELSLNSVGIMDWEGKLLYLTAHCVMLQT